MEADNNMRQKRASVHQEALVHRRNGVRNEKHDCCGTKGSKISAIHSLPVKNECVRKQKARQGQMYQQQQQRQQKLKENSQRVRRLKQQYKTINLAGVARLSTSFTMLQFVYISILLLSAVNVVPIAADSPGDDLFTVVPITDAPQPQQIEFDYANRGKKKFGDKCESTQECGFPGSICDSKKRSCQCIEDLPVTNHIDKCGKEASVNESCFFNEQCEAFNFQTECRDNRCICRFEMSPILNKDGTVECKATQESREPERYIDPAMIGILAGMALMFIIICVVLRLFSRARWRENRTIFNTPNPRLMNVSLLRDNKLMHSQERRGSRMSMRMPSRQPSMASLRPHSPNPSIGSTRGSRNNSNTSAASTRSNRSGSTAHSMNTKTNHHHEGKCRVPTTVLEANAPITSTEPIVTDGNNHDSSIITTATTHVNTSPISISKSSTIQMADI